MLLSVFLMLRLWSNWLLWERLFVSRLLPIGLACGFICFGVEAKLYMAYCTRTGRRYPFLVSVVEIQIQFGCVGLWSDRLKTSHYLPRYRKLGLGILG